MRPLAFIGRHATKFMAAGVLAGFLVPPLAALAKPLLAPTLVIPLALALVRLDWSAMTAFRRRPRLVLSLVVFMLGVSPLLVWAITTPALALGLPAGLREALILMAASSPIISNIAIALFVGLDAALAAVVVVFSTALVPFTLPSMALALLDLELAISLPAFMARLAALVGGAFVAAWLVRRLVPQGKLAAWREPIDGLAVVNLFVFALAIMDGVTAFSLERPSYALLAVALASPSICCCRPWVARLSPPRRSHRAHGRPHVRQLQHGARAGGLTGHVDVEVTAFFALAQVPMYVLPVLLEPLYRRARTHGRDAGSREAPRPR